MKRIYLFLIITLSALKASAQVDYSFQWGHLFDGPTKAGDNCVLMAQAADGNIFQVLSWGSTEELGCNIYLDGEKLKDNQGNEILGFPYNSGTSYTANTFIAKQNPTTGDFLWKLYTVQGYVDSGCLNLETTSDGGAVLIIEMRQSQGASDVLADFVSPSGTHTIISHDNQEQWCYRTVILRITAEGEISWYRVIRQNDMINGNNASLSHYCYGATLDKDENIYICGNYRNKLFFTNTDGKTDSIVAHNNAEWNGDSQKTIGDLFIAKFNNEGYFVEALTSPDTVDCAFMDNIIYEDGKLYVVGRSADTAERAFRIGDFKIQDNKFQSIFVACLNTDLTVNYTNIIQATAASDGKHTTQVKNFQKNEDKLFICGLVKGGFQTGETEWIASKGSPLEGFVLSLSAADGSVTNALIKGYGITGYFGAKELKNGGIMAVGYYMAGNDGKTGCVADVYDTDNKLISNTQLVDFGMMGLIACPLFIGDNELYIQTRGGKTVTIPSFYGCNTTYASSNYWAATFAKYTISGDTFLSAETETAITDVVEENSNSSSIYTLDGRMISKDGQTNGLRPGLYIKSGKKFLVK
jgi:hypothetical protein